MQNRQLDKLEQDNIPYIGPRPFEPKHRNLFFGRDLEVTHIISLILSNPLTIIYAQSGTGKTSLFNARILFELQEEYEFQTFRSAGVRSLLDRDKIPDGITNIYMFNTLHNLYPTSNLESLKEKTFSDFLNQDQLKDKSGDEPVRRLIVLDQLEELFNLYPEHWDSQQLQFFIQIAKALSDNPMLRVVLIIREEYLARLSPFANLFPERMKSRFRLERLNRGAALLAVTEPLKLTGLSFAPGVAEIIVGDLLTMRVEDPFGKIVERNGEYVEPVHLQVVCQSLWRKAVSSGANQITQAQFRGSAGVTQALTEFYLDTIHHAAKMSRINEDVIRKWFEEKLITSSGTRGIVHRESESTGGLTNSVVDILEDRYLIRKEERAGAKWYELTHDRLIQPIKDSNKARREQQRRSKRSLVVMITLPIIVIALIGISLSISNHQQQQQILTNQAAINQNLDTIIKSGVSLANFGNYTGTRINFDKALSLDPRNKVALYNKGVVFEHFKNYTEAMKYYDMSLSSDPYYISPLHGKGLMLNRLGNHTGAIKYYDAALAINPIDINSLANKGLALYHLGNYTGAIKYYDKVLAINSTYPIALKNKGLVLDILGNYTGAIITYDKVLAINATDPSTLANKALVLYQLGNYTGAIKYYDKALAINSTYPIALKDKGLVLYQLGNYTGAIKYYDKALAINATDPFTLANKALVLYQLGNYTGAIKYYDKVLAINATDPSTLANKALVLYHLGNYTGAIKYYDKALAINSTDPFTLANKALVLYHLGNYTGAIKYYDKALAINSTYPIALKNKGLALDSLGNYTGAIKYYDKAL